MIELMIALAKKNNISKDQQLALQKKRFDPFELLTLKKLEREELMYLMIYCEVRVLNGTPVAAMTDDELRMAYVLWRAAGQKEREAKEREAKRRIRVFSRAAKELVKRSAIQ